MSYSLPVASRPSMPEGSYIIKDYATLRDKASKFAAGAYNLLVIAGAPGLSKTTIFKQSLKAAHKDDWCYIEGNAGPFGAYCKCWDYRNMPVLMDDADQINQQQNGKRFLKQIGQTEHWKHCSWESKATQKKNPPAPPEYYTSSKVAILTNDWCYKSGNVHTAAVEDRGQVYIFAPTALEVHRYVATWFWDQEIFTFIAKHLPYLRVPSCRLYVKAEEMKKAGDDWQGYILSMMFDKEDTEYQVILLMNNNALSNNAKAQAFIASGHGSRATFYRYFADLKERHGLQEVPDIKVQGTEPEPGPDPMAWLVDQVEEEEEGD